jgi:hypothetical protein
VGPGHGGRSLKMGLRGVQLPHPGNSIAVWNLVPAPVPQENIRPRQCLLRRHSRRVRLNPSALASPQSNWVPISSSQSVALAQHSEPHFPACDQHHRLKQGGQVIRHQARPEKVGSQ